MLDIHHENSTGFVLSGASLLPLQYLSISHTPARHVIIATFLLAVCLVLYWKPSKGIAAPFVGIRWSWEPPLLTQMRYTFNAASMIDEGYNKWKDSMFQISRYDRDILVVSRKYLDDLHNRPPGELSAIHGLIENFGGHYSGIGLLGKHDVGIRALQTKITPSLTKLCDDMQDELEYSLRTDLPPCQDWTAVPIQPFFLKVVERIVHRIFVGLPLCRDDEWLKAAFGHADNVTMTQIAMRSVPWFLQPFLNVILPFTWRYKGFLRVGKKILIPEVERRREIDNSGGDRPVPNDLLQAMITMTDPKDENGQPEILADLMLTMTAVAGHSTAASGSHVLFDVVARPGYVDSLREEAEAVFHGKQVRFTKQVLADLRKLDSFMRESQRHSPLSLLGFLRVVKAPAGITLQDGTHIPYGTQLCIPPKSISMDPAIISNPNTFNGLRYYQQRCQDPSQNNKHQYATADKSHLNFGYGNWACPGRFMASDILKMVLTTLLLRYDFRYPRGSERPTNGYIHEFPLLEIQTPLLMKRRDG
ncbi:hypothetical protein ED733_001934 [Metarhizium rileyi]|uniref:Cytochrome P450 n=1 Tax=Metarhizium rileyi (strain RCEF 4871) TaxID=1649241 RepID=A0A5C6FZX4_METRR|nr:hypothetical protein ED733_001934 [Metarhizium rileyi]